MLTKTITPTILSTNIGAVTQWIKEGYTLIVVNKKQNNLPLFKVVAITPVNKSKSTTRVIDVLDDLDSGLITPPTQYQLDNPYEILDQETTKHNKKPLYRFATSR
jgi:hypothetical protein